MPFSSDRALSFGGIYRLYLQDKKQQKIVAILKGPENKNTQVVPSGK
jgi:hypothetical protein